MSENQQISEMTVDRREETVVTHQPGYAATERVVHDVAAERRIRVYLFIRIIQTILGILEILLGLRFLLKFIGSNPGSGFASLIYGITGTFYAPFAGLVPNPVFQASVLEVTTLIAMAVYALAFWIIVRVIQIMEDRPSARSVTRTVREQVPDGTDHTINTISRT